jgi:Nucleotidyl transferase
LLTTHCDQTDFGREIIPASARDYNVRAYLFKDYWEDIGTVEAFYHANLALTYQPDPPFSFYDEKAPIYTRSRYLPPTKMLDSRVIESMVVEGCILKECTVKRSVIGIRSRIETGCVIDNSLLMGSDYYQSPAERLKDLQNGKVPLGVGANTRGEGPATPQEFSAPVDVYYAAHPAAHLVAARAKFSDSPSITEDCQAISHRLDLEDHKCWRCAILFALDFECISLYSLSVQLGENYVEREGDGVCFGAVEVE